jgi:hypothetical protein
MLRAVITELRARRAWIGLAAWCGCLVICCVISAVPLPSFGGDALSGQAQHLAYGYLYFPVLVLPVLALWYEEPMQWAVGSGRHRSGIVSAIIMGTGTALTLIGAAVTGLITRDTETLWASIPNALWTSALLVVVRWLIAGPWATLIVFAYGTAGLFSPTVPFLLVNREPDPSRLSLAVLAMAAVVVLRARGHLLPRRTAA